MSDVMVHLDVQTAVTIGTGIATLGGVWFVTSYRLKALEKGAERRKVEDAKRDQERAAEQSRALDKLSASIGAQLSAAQAMASKDIETVRTEVRSEIALHRASIAEIKSDMNTRMATLAASREHDSARMTEFMIEMKSSMATVQAVVSRIEKRGPHVE